MWNLFSLEVLQCVLVYINSYQLTEQNTREDKHRAKYINL